MTLNKIFIFVEGDYDKSFFEQIICPRFKTRNKDTKIIPYHGDYYKGKKGKELIVKIIKSVDRNNKQKKLDIHYDYLIVTDIDRCPCVTSKKKEFIDKIKNIDNNKIIVVIKEIEGWYLAGLDEKSLKRIGIRRKLKDTNNITKNEFMELVPKEKMPKEFALEILSLYSLDVGIQKNQSLKYFIKKYLSD